MKKIFKIFVSFALMFLASVPFVYAADLDVTCNNDGCNLSSSDPLFSFTNIYPNWSTTKTVKAINNYDQDADFAIETISFNDPNSLGDVLNIAIKEKGAGGNLYNDNLTELNIDGYKKLSSISKKKDKEYEFIVSMLTSADDKYQNKQLSFDLDLGFELIPVSSPPLGASHSPSSKVGGAAASSSPADTFTWAGFTFPAPRTFISRILGVEDEPEASPPGPKVAGVVETAPEVKGDTCEWYYYLWWVPLVIQAILTAVYYYWLKKKDVAAWWILPIVLAVLSQIIHEILGCECVISRWCPWFWLFNLIILISLTYYYAYTRKKQSSDLTEE